MIQLWDASARRIVRSISLDRPCFGLWFSSDGQRLATVTSVGAVGLNGQTFPPRGAADCEIDVWSVSEGTNLAHHRPAISLSVHRGTPFAVSDDFKLAAIAIYSGRVQVIDLATGYERWTAQTDGYVLGLAFSSDGKILAMSGPFSDPRIRLWDVESGKETGQLLGHRAGAVALQFSPDGRTLASASADQTVRLWDVESRRLVRTLRGHKLEVWRFALLPDKTTLVSGAKDGEVLLWDLGKERAASAISFVPGARWAFVGRGDAVVTVDQNGVVSRWQGRNFQQKILLFEGVPVSATRPPVLDDRGQWIAAREGNGPIRVWDCERRAIIHEFVPDADSAYPVRFLENGTKLILRSDAAGAVNLEEWELTSKRKTRFWQMPEDLGMARLYFAPNGERAYALTETFASEFDLRNIRERRIPIKNRQGNAGVGISWDGTLLGTSSALGLARVWETTHFREVGTFGGFMMGLSAVAFSPDRQRIALGGNTLEAMSVWDLNSQEPLWRYESRGVFYWAAFSTDGNVLGAVGVESGKLHLWRAPSWEEIEAAERAAAAAQPKDGGTQ